MTTRTSGHITNAEYVLPEGEVIITHTDPSSRITYANPAFLTSSEYTLEECLGQPQNIVRHPDMPRQAFADLWRTIGAGKSWTGLVKNRRKSGGFYWVRANVTPMIDPQRGEVVGYMSVRVKPTRAEIQEAEQVYAAIREQAEGIEQINKAVTQMDNITQQDAHLAQQLTETAQSLQQQSTQMLAAISAFSMQHGNGDASSGARRTPARRPTHADEQVETRRVA